MTEECGRDTRGEGSEGTEGSVGRAGEGRGRMDGWVDGWMGGHCVLRSIPHGGLAKDWTGRHVEPGHGRTGQDRTDGDCCSTRTLI